MSQRESEPLNMQAAIVLSPTNKAKTIKDGKIIVVERHSTSPFDLYYLAWYITDGRVADNYGTSEISLLDLWLRDYGLSSEDRLWEPM